MSVAGEFYDALLERSRDPLRDSLNIPHRWTHLRAFGLHAGVSLQIPVENPLSGIVSYCESVIWISKPAGQCRMLT
jgi:hypothetical protein